MISYIFKLSVLYSNRVIVRYEEKLKKNLSPEEIVANLYDIR